MRACASAAARARRGSPRSSRAPSARRGARARRSSRRSCRGRPPRRSPRSAHELGDAVDDRAVVVGRRREHLVERTSPSGASNEDVGERPADVGAARIRRPLSQTAKSWPSTMSSEPVISVTICWAVASAVAHVADLDAVAEHHDPVGHLEHVLHVVADEEHGDAALGHRPDELQHLDRLPDAERRGGLVQHHDVPPPGDRAADGDHLPLAARQRRDLSPCLDRQPERSQVLVGLAVHAPPVEQPERAHHRGCRT